MTTKHFLHLAIVSSLVLLWATSSVAQTFRTTTSSPHAISFKERVQITTDRDLYVAGEDVLLKVYKQNAQNNEADSLSKVVYVELLNSSNNTVAQYKLYADAWTANAAILLPDTVSTGRYLLRAYTNWMKNFSPDLFGYQQISVINPFRALGHNPKPIVNPLPDSVAFYPEGGSLVAGSHSRLALRVFDRRKATIDGLRTCLVANTDTIACDSTREGGRAFLNFDPTTDTNYTLVVYSDTHSPKSFKLPVIKQSGVTITATVDSHLNIAIGRHGTVPANLTLYAISNGAVVYTEPIRNASNIAVNLHDLPAGIVQLQVVGDDKTTEAFRWILLPQTEQTRVVVDGLKDVYTKRGSVNFSVEIAGMPANELCASYSVAVIKPCFATQKAVDDILKTNNTLITCPQQACKPTDFIVKKEASFDKLPEIEGHIVSGIITDSVGTPLTDSLFVFAVVGQTAKCRFTKTNNEGQFYFVLNEQGEREIVIQPQHKTDAKYYVELDYPFSSDFGPMYMPPFYPDTTQLAAINQGIINTQIQKRFADNTEASNPPATHKLSFYGLPENMVSLNEFIALDSLHEVLKEIVPLVYNHGHHENYSIQMLNKITHNKFDHGPYLLLDGVPVYNANELRRVHPKDLDRIELTQLNYFADNEMLEGILHFITRRGNMDGYNFPASFFRQAYRGYHTATSSFPTYETNEQRNSRTPDRRNTLYWQPEVNSKPQQKQNIRFFTADEEGEYMVVIKGITTSGKEFYYNSSFFVRD